MAAGELLGFSTSPKPASSPCCTARVARDQSGASLPFLAPQLVLVAGTDRWMDLGQLWGTCLGMQSGHPAALREARPGLFHPPMVWWEPPLGCGEGLLPLGPRGCSWPAVSRLAERCQRSYSWPSLADSLALWESAVISSVIKGLRACSTPLKKQENNNNDLCSGMLLSGIRIAFTAFWLRKLLMLQL